MKEGTQISSINVKDLKNHDINLIEKYKGQNLLIIIYNNQCLGCTGRGIPLAYELGKEFRHIQPIAIHTRFDHNESICAKASFKPTTVNEIREIFTTGKEPFPIYLDEDNSVYKQFESKGTPQWLIINREGKLFRSFFGSMEGAQNRLGYSIMSLK
ncbi:MAG: hypothetical protein WC140_01335 [Bacteroidales bacterium]